ncbi:hypothetical protein N7931_05705 [Catenovulum sp. 2E275]|uniref:hypothetical protein n=1 Tax=Catenovulum sp. 2E275 TaxID=2980497 RepID=UPI0021CE7F8B|nr:hypothetical protein [Catenovulum sp. 2E275]MCU4675124.1 hypothetical protein [Catenovulum sp. 2E275]
MLIRPGQAQIELDRYDQVSCIIDETAELPTFTFLTASSLDVDKIINSLCHHPAIQASYSKVKVLWPPRESLSAEPLLNGEYQVVWSREQNFAGVLPNYKNYFKTLIKVDGYKVYWYSHQPNLELTQAFLQDKKIGVLDSKVSHSHYILPLSSLKQANINLATEQIVHYPDGLSLYAAFRHGEVDMISSGAWLESSLQRPVHKLLIDDNAVAFSLFISLDTPKLAQCAMLEAMKPVYSVFERDLIHLNLPDDVKELCY